MSNRNVLLAAIVAKVLGTVRNPHNRNMLLEDWLKAVGGIVPGYPEEYTFDGIDDYITVADGSPVELLAGDVVSFDFTFSHSDVGMKLVGSEEGIGSERLYINITSTDTIAYNNSIISVVNMPSGSPLVDGSSYSIVVNILKVCSISTIGASANLTTNFFNNVIKNVKVTRLNPTLSHPNLYWPIDDGWAANPMIRQVIPHGMPYDGRMTFDSDGQVWNDLSDTTQQYTFDGIDDYVTIPTVDLVAGDIVEFDFAAPITAYTSFNNLTDAAASALLSRINSDGTFLGTALAEYSLDGVSISNGTVMPIDGRLHHLKMTVTGSRTLGVLGATISNTNFFNNVIKNLRITRANPTASNPDLFYPMNDAWANNPEIAQVNPLTHLYATNGAVTYNSATNVFFDYTNEVDPKYGDIAADNNEAVARAAEGDVRNGDFRFGDNGDWDLSVAMSIADGKLSIVNSTAQFATQAFIFEAGETYTTTCDVVVDLGVDFKLPYDGAGVNAVSVSETGTYSHTFLSGGSVTLYTVFATGFTGIVSNISVRKATNEVVTSNTVYPYQGTAYNFQSTGWNDIGAAPQYAGVVGYETLAERSALSGLSELEESKRSAAEGDVKNGDFRFGDNGDWTQSNSWDASTSEMVLSANGAERNTNAIGFGGAVIGEEYYVSFTIKELGSGSGVGLYAAGTDLSAVAVYESAVGEYMYRVIATATSIQAKLRSHSLSSSGVVSRVSIRKATSQQVLTPTVNDGLANNFNPEGWSNYVPPEPVAFVTSDDEDFYTSGGEQFLVQGEE